MAMRKPSNGGAGAGVDEDKLDSMLDDSFPASDPPSFTPVARVGEPPADEIDDYPGDDRGPNRLMCIALGTIALGAAAFVIFRAVRGREQRKPKRFHGIQAPQSASAVLQPLLDAAQSGMDSAAKARKEAMRRAA